MNSAQSACLKVGAWAVGAMLLIPPVVATDGIYRVSRGYHFLFSLEDLQVNASQLMVQIFAVLVMTGLLYLSCSTKET